MDRSLIIPKDQDTLTSNHFRESSDELIFSGFVEGDPEPNSFFREDLDLNVSFDDEGGVSISGPNGDVEFFSPISIPDFIRIFFMVKEV